MSVKKAVGLVALALALGAGTASATEGPNVGRFSVGPQVMDVGGIFAAGLSSRYWVNNEFGVEGNIYYGTHTDKYTSVLSYEVSSSTILASLKVLYAPVVSENSRFYVGLEGGLGSYSWDSNGVEDGKEDYYLVKPFIGTEFNFSEFKQIGFNVELGYAFAGTDNDNVYYSDKEDLSRVTVGGGMHYYF